MKLLLIALALVSSTTSLFAADGCEKNAYGLTKESLVVAYDWTEKVYATRTGQAEMGEFFFNTLIDSSCVKVDITDRGAISCVNADGSKVAVGYVAQELLGNYSDYVFYRGEWTDNVSIISKKVNGNCVYGIQVK